MTPYTPRNFAIGGSTAREGQMDYFFAITAFHIQIVGEKKGGMVDDPTQCRNHHHHPPDVNIKRLMVMISVVGKNVVRMQKAGGGPRFKACVARGCC